MKMKVMNNMNGFNVQYCYEVDEDEKHYINTKIFNKCPTAYVRWEDNELFVLNAGNEYSKGWSEVCKEFLDGY
jgi:hypothetical protein